MTGILLGNKHCLLNRCTNDTSLGVSCFVVFMASAAHPSRSSSGHVVFVFASQSSMHTGCNAVRVPTEVALSIGIIRELESISGHESIGGSTAPNVFRVVDSVSLDSFIPIVDWILLKSPRDERLALLQSSAILRVTDAADASEHSDVDQVHIDEEHPYICFDESVRQQMETNEQACEPSEIPRPLVGTLAAFLRLWENDFLRVLSDRNVVTTVVKDADFVGPAPDVEVHTPVTLLETLEATTYFQVYDLQSLLAAQVASDIRSMSVNAARAYLMEPDDLSPEEKSRILDENRWIEVDDEHQAEASDV